VLRNPVYGYGKNLNPCIDCHAYMLKTASRYMESLGASFLATGEVLGQRPMSQNRSALQAVEKLSGMRGLIVRPLSGRLLPPTIPEQEGWLDREKLLDISGRKVMSLQPGANDVSGLAPGVYFVRAAERASIVRKVIIAR
jgi:tRNA U34 2-thiouridine synthase MnmA/TrmU